MLGVMVEAAVKLLDDDTIVLRRAGIRFPVELRPAAFDPSDLSTWPEAEGRLEWVGGRLLYMPPCADVQQDVAADVIYLLRSWSESRNEFVVAGNEAGMKLGKDIRAADAAVWRRADVGLPIGKLRRTPPVLAVEIAGEDEDEQILRDKARWYLANGAAIVWIVLPEQREVLVLQHERVRRCAHSERLPEASQLPGLVPEVDQFFVQLDVHRREPARPAL